MTLKEAFVGVVVTIIGGVAVYWFTTGMQNEQQRKEHQQEVMRQQEDERRSQEEAARQRLLDQQRADEERARREEAERQRQPRMSELETDINRNGSDYKDFVAANVSECLATCAREAQCKAITFTKSSRQCWMKFAVPLRQNDGRYISAVKVGG